jgi:hypothetical protein
MTSAETPRAEEKRLLEGLFDTVQFDKPKDGEAMPDSGKKASDDQYPTGSAVLWYRDGDRSREPQNAVIAVAPHRHADGVSRATIEPGWIRVPVEHLAPHPQRHSLAALEKPNAGELDWPPPDCPHCDVPTSYDCGPYCEECGTRWSSSGYDGVRRCVECDHDATVVGADGQPRCGACQLAIITGEEEPTGPYECRRCKARVVGIGHGPGQAGERRLCGSCNAREESDRWIADYLAKKSGEK